jgi:hypothetical protein
MLRVLELRGLDPSRAEDLVQEVGVRAITAGVEFEGLDDFLWWALPVVRNLHVDQIRASRWSVSAAELPDREDPEPGVDHVVERRLALESVLTHLSAMPEPDREAIVTGATDAPVDAGRKGAVAVRRHRARANLRRMVGTALGLTGAGAFARRLRTAGIVTPVTTVALGLPVLVLGVAVLPDYRAEVANGSAFARPVVIRPGTRGGAVATPAGAGGVAAAPPAPPAAPEVPEAPVARAVLVAPVAPESEELPERVDVESPVDDHGVNAQRRDSHEEDPLVCVYGGDYVHSRCLWLPHDTVNENVSLR